MHNDLPARRHRRARKTLQKEDRAGGRGTAGRREQHARWDNRGVRLARSARLCQIHVAQAGLDAGAVGGRADVANRAVSAGLEVADEVVVRKRQRGERHEIDRDDELENYAQPAPGDSHLGIIYSPSHGPRQRRDPVAHGPIRHGRAHRRECRRLPVSAHPARCAARAVHRNLRHRPRVVLSTSSRSPRSSGGFDTAEQRPTVGRVPSRINA